MPIDLKKIINQIKTIKVDDSTDIYQKRLESTYKLFNIAKENTEKLINRTSETQISSSANFFFAIPHINKNENIKLDSIKSPDLDFSTPHITIATDGSQINPSLHEFTQACLINIGLVAIPYFNISVPVELSSEPTVYPSLDELYPNNFSERIQEEYLISCERTLKEIEALLKLARKYIGFRVPIIALLDGTLIHWHLERFNDLFIKRFIERFSNVLHELKSLKIPVASFLSNSRSNDLINMLRVFRCPYDQVNCNKHCKDTESKNLPCNPTLDYKPVLDRKLIEKWFFKEAKTKLGDRTILFKSNSDILTYYPDDLKIFFFYMNTGNDIARIELPSYVIENKELLSLLHNAITLQCKVGQGYPITLSEAHLQAVVNKTDRELFYSLLKEHFLKKTKTPVKISNKELKKRISFV